MNKKMPWILEFKGNGKDSRASHLFIAFGTGLGKALHETTLGKVTAETDATLTVLQERYKRTGYPNLTFLQSKIGAEGNSAAKDYPDLDRFKECAMTTETTAVERATQRVSER